MNPRACKIAELNDRARRLLGVPSSREAARVVISNGVRQLPLETRVAVQSAVRDFKTFDPGDDPYGGHDFGALEVDGHKIFFKFDYFEAGTNCMYGAEDPTDALRTERVLTIMLDEDY